VYSFTLSPSRETFTVWKIRWMFQNVLPGRTRCLYIYGGTPVDASLPPSPPLGYPLACEGCASRLLRYVLQVWRTRNRSASLPARWAPALPTMRRASGKRTLACWFIGPALRSIQRFSGHSRHTATLAPFVGRTHYARGCVGATMIGDPVPKQAIRAIVPTAVRVAIEHPKPG
jgi:hypothetical protein